MGAAPAGLRLPINFRGQRHRLGSAADIIIDGCNSRAGNDIQANGCTVADDVDQCAIRFPDKPLHYLACVVKETDRLARARIITRKEQAGIVVCSALTFGH